MSIEIRPVSTSVNIGDRIIANDGDTGIVISLNRTSGMATVRILDGRGHLRTLEDIERDLIQLAIEIYAGHMSEVARRLGIGRSTLYRKVREQGLEDLVKGGEAADEAAA